MSPIARTPRSRRTVLGVVAALVLLAGCGSSGSEDRSDGGASSASSTTAPSSDTTADGDETTTTTTDDGGDAPDSKEAYVQAVAESMREVEDEVFPIDDEQADCLAPLWVDAIGYETLLDAKVSPEVLGGTEDGDTDAEFEDVVDRPRAEKLIDTFGECGVDLEDFFFEGLASDGSATPAQIDCIRGRLPDGFVRTLMITSMAGGDDALDSDGNLEDQLTQSYMACLAEG